MHVSIDLSFHKLATVPPSRPDDSSLMVTKILGFTPLHQTNSSNLNHIRGAVPSRVWAVGLLPKSFWD